MHLNLNKFLSYKKRLQYQLSNYKNQNNLLLPLAYQFFKNQSQELLEKLNHKITQSKKSLTGIKQPPERSTAEENELETRIVNHQKARDELNVVAAFYRQFDAL